MPTILSPRLLAIPDQTEDATIRAGRRLLSRSFLGVLERRGPNFFERIFERMMKRGASSTVEHVAEHVAESLATKVTTKAISSRRVSIARPVVDRASHNAAKKGLKKGLQRTVNTGMHVEKTAIPRLKVLISIVGLAMVFHMVHTDIHRWKQERAKNRRATSTYLFLIASIFDTVDLLVHVVVLIFMLFCSQHEEQLAKCEHVGTVCAVLAMIAMMAGELTAELPQTKAEADCIHHSYKVNLVPCSGNASNRISVEPEMEPPAKNVVSLNKVNHPMIG